MIRRLLTGIVFGYGFLALLTAAYYSVNIPFWDEWGTIRWVERGWDWHSITEFHNEHRMVSTHILFLINRTLTGLNLRFQILLNLGLYAALVVWFWKSCLEPLQEAILGFPRVLLLIPLFCSLQAENWLMAFQVGVMVMLFSFLVGSWFLFTRSGIYATLLGLFFWAIAAFSFGSGLPAIIGSGIASWFYLSRPKALLISIFVFAIALLWAHGYLHPVHHPSLSYPWRWSFWRGLGELIALGFGYQEFTGAGWVPGLWAMMAAAAGLLLLLKKPESGYEASLALGFILIFVSMASGRAEFGPGALSAPRYATFSAFAPYGFALAMSKLSPRFSKMMGVILAMGLGLGMLEHLGPGPYEAIHANRIEIQRCIHDYLVAPTTNPSVICPAAFPYSLLDPIQNAQRLHLSFLPKIL